MHELQPAGHPTLPPDCSPRAYYTQVLPPALLVSSCYRYKNNKEANALDLLAKMYPETRTGDIGDLVWVEWMMTGRAFAAQPRQLSTTQLFLLLDPVASQLTESSPEGSWEDASAPSPPFLRDFSINPANRAPGFFWLEHHLHLRHLPDPARFPTWIPIHLEGHFHVPTPSLAHASPIQARSGPLVNHLS